jgi:hypothetical protein
VYWLWTSTNSTLVVASSQGDSRLRSQIISHGNNGLLKADGDFGTSPEDIERIFQTYFPRITKGWAKKRILLYAHGGLVDENYAGQRLADYRAIIFGGDERPEHNCSLHLPLESTGLSQLNNRPLTRSREITLCIIATYSQLNNCLLDRAIEIYPV